ncbi:Hypothetical predicted protein [Mytilus galloprovincialis]|uniref:Uncharacterized protein n=1 Tax=Mytilus galloprovincialis TaxID=29158 RepID=A0A8B6DEU1_MYTGA|nr:Hypothetical predicted protein [Mytilus galloprovincialis]
MATKEDVADLKNIMLSIDSKVTNFSSRLDSVEKNLTELISDVKSEVGQVKSDLSITNTEVQQLRQDHNELERGVGHLESQFNCLETEKLELLKLDIDKNLLHSKNVKYYLRNMIGNTMSSSMESNKNQMR